MNRLVTKYKGKINNNKENFLSCIISTFIIGLIAHAYMYFSDSFSHDSLNEFLGDPIWKIQLGRFFVPLYEIITCSNITLPWLTGLYTLLWISFSVFFTVKLFDIKNKFLIVLISGLYATNLTVIATTATYIHDLDGNMFALFMSVLAVYLWHRFKIGYLLSSLCVFVLLGLYQSYISVFITLVIIFLVINLLNKENFKCSIIMGLKSILAIIIGSVLYLLVYKLIFVFTNIPTVESYNSLSAMQSLSLGDIIQETLYTYVYTCGWFLIPTNSFRLPLNFIATVIATVVASCVICSKIFGEDMAIKEKVLTLFLILIMPIGMNVSRILSGGQSHDLMRYAACLPFLMILLVVYNFESPKFRKNREANSHSLPLAKIVCSVFILIVLFNNIVLANKVYIKKDLEQDAALSYFTRVVAKMDELEGYDNKTTPVVFIGMPEHFKSNMSGFDNNYMLGVTYSYVPGAALPSFYKQYFMYKLQYPIVTVDNTAYEKMKTVKNMPVFPDEGSLLMINDVLVVKLGE